MAPYKSGLGVKLEEGGVWSGPHGDHNIRSQRPTMATSVSSAGDADQAFPVGLTRRT